MNIKIITAASAIVLGLAFAGPAAAQTMLGGVAVSDADLPKVQEKCDALNTTASLSTDSATTTATTPGAQDTPAAPATTPPAAGTATGEATAINLDSITIEQCKEAGLVK